MDELLRNEILVPLKNSEQLMHFYLNVKLRAIILLFQYLNNVFHIILMCYLPMENSYRNYLLELFDFPRIYSRNLFSVIQVARFNLKSDNSNLLTSNNLTSLTSKVFIVHVNAQTNKKILLSYHLWNWTVVKNDIQLLKTNYKVFALEIKFTEVCCPQDYFHWMFNESIYHTTSVILDINSNILPFAYLRYIFSPLGAVIILLPSILNHSQHLHNISSQLNKNA